MGLRQKGANMAVKEGDLFMLKDGSRILRMDSTKTNAYNCTVLGVNSTYCGYIDKNSLRKMYFPLHKLIYNTPVGRELLLLKYPKLMKRAQEKGWL